MKNLNSNKSLNSNILLNISIWSVSLITSITGLAISPSLPDIQRHFPKIDKSEIDMLISLPAFLLIPFVIISGKMAHSKNNLLFIRLGSIIFIACAIAYQFDNDFNYILFVSVLLGLGGGLVVPLAAQLPTRYYSGIALQKQLGICSGVANGSQVICTFLAGWLATIDWHYPFWVYSIAVIPLLLSPLLSSRKALAQYIMIKEKETADVEKKTSINKVGLLLIMFIYFIVMFFNIQIPLNLPFLLSTNGISTDISGVLISIFFFVQAISAFLINSTIKFFRYYTMAIAVLIIAVILIFLPLIHNYILYYILVSIAGITGGTIEPIVWNKTSHICSHKNSTIAFGWVMSACYLSVFATPYIISIFSKLFHVNNVSFPFIISGIIAFIFSMFLFIKNRSTIFGMKNEVLLILEKNNKNNNIL